MCNYKSREKEPGWQYIFRQENYWNQFTILGRKPAKIAPVFFLEPLPLPQWAKKGKNSIIIIERKKCLPQRRTGQAKR